MIQSDNLSLGQFQCTANHISGNKVKLYYFQTLLAYGADVNAVSKEHNTPLHGAHRNKMVWDLLVEKGADLTAKNMQGQTPEEVPSR